MTNVRSKSKNKKKGRYVYLTWAQVKEKFGTANAKLVRDAKYTMEKTRDPSDTSPAWWCPHPELPQNEDIVCLTL